jgi:hypothetical protein
MAILVQSSDPGRKEPPPRLREDLKQRHQRATAAAELRAMLNALGLTPRHAARIFAVGPRSIRRWQDGARGVPRAVTLVCRLMAVGAVTIAQVEQAAVPSPTRTNGGTKGEPPAPLRVAPTPEEQSASARARTAARADLGLTTAEKLLALVPGTCRWPCGDPQRPDFYFCGNAALTPPYCEQHRALAYLAPRPGRGHGGFVTYGRHGRPSIPGAFSATGASQAPKILLDRAGDLPGGAPPPA